jgi:hypothetical protein
MITKEFRIFYFRILLHCVYTLTLPSPLKLLQLSEALGLWTLSIVRNSKLLQNTTFSKLELFPYSGEGRETPTLLVPLELT